MSKDKQPNKTEKEEEIDVNDLIDNIDDGQTQESDGSDVGLREPTDEEKEKIMKDLDDVNKSVNKGAVNKESGEKSNTVMVSDLQPKRTKPGYPQELANNRGFGYNISPSNK